MILEMIFILSLYVMFVILIYNLVTKQNHNTEKKRSFNY